MSDEESDDQMTEAETVGYCQPPVSTRFQKGQSGNPRGRPRGSMNLKTLLYKAMREKVVINEHGKRKVVTKLEASSKQLVNQAASGKHQALRFLFELLQQIEKTEDQPQAVSAAFSEIDQEVIQGILNRFQPQEVQAESELETQSECALNEPKRS